MLYHLSENKVTVYNIFNLIFNIMKIKYLKYDLSAIVELKSKLDSLSEFLTKTVQFHNKSLIILYCSIVLISNRYFVDHYIIIICI